MRLHNIFIAGAAKAGTTALYYLFNQHPQICSPLVKEPNYFSNMDNEQDVVKPGTGPGDGSTIWTASEEAYHALYRYKPDQRFKLDASVSYLYSNNAARHIAEYSPDAHIIIVLRDPVERAWSHYKHLVRDSREECSFEEALDREEKRIRKGWEFSWHFKQMGLYSRQVQRYFDHFDRRQIHIFLFEDIKKDIGQVIKEAADFTGLPGFDYHFEQTRHNASGMSRSRTLSGLVNRVVGYKAIINKVVSPAITHRLMQLFRSVNIKKDELYLKKKTRERLISFFEDDIRKTASLIGRDLSGWLIS